MNRSYRLVWRAVQSAYVPVPEFARSGRTSARLRVLSAAVMSTLALNAHALPTGGQVSAGQGSIAQSGSTMTVTQQSQNMAVNWQTFGIGATEAVGFAQPNASAIALNRVLGADPTQIYGRLTANGQVWILNPNGVFFGGGAQVNVGGLVASTLNLSDADFLAGKRSFSGSGGSVINQGSITAADGGYVALLGARVSNEGVIQAKLGTVALGAGNQITLDFAGDKLLSLQVDQGAVDALAQNKQLIQADGGTVLLSAKAAGALLNTVVNNEGVIEARSIDTHNGTIRLLGGMDGGTVKVAGTLDASAPNGGDGGFIETSGAHVAVADGAAITTVAPKGKTGTWLIDPNDFTIAASGGDISGGTLATQLGSNNVTILSSDGATAGNGDINVNDAVSWNAGTALTLNAWRNININQSISAADANGKLALLYGQGAIASGNAATYNVNAPVNLQAGSNFITKLGNDGSTVSYTVITSLGAQGSTTGTDLQGMQGNTSLNYALGANIDASATSGWNGGGGFAPTPSFGGVFDGLGHTISGLVINRPSQDYVGLFGQSGGTIRDIGLVGGTITGHLFAGALLGLNFTSGSVSSSYSTGSVSGTERVGGLVGDNRGTISNSYSGGAVHGSGNYQGGLVGANVFGVVYNSHASGTVDGGYYVGGLVGGNSAVVHDSYATGSVTGQIAGGLIGYNFSSGAVSNAYATGSVPGSNSGGLVASNDGTVQNSYWDINTSGRATSAGGTGLTTTQMMQAASFTGFDFTNAWWISEGNTRPFLRSEYSTTIANAHQLQLMAMDPTASYSLARNIDMSELSRASGLWNVTAGFVPIGDFSAPFSGSLDGAGHEVSGITINRPSESELGLFKVLTGSVTNLGVTSASINGQSNVGAFAGVSEGGIVSNVYSSGTIAAAGGSIGGLIGTMASGATISNSHSAVAITANGDQVGGLVGNMQFGNNSVNSSYSTGAVAGQSNVGGLVGVSHGQSAINDSYNTGAVTGQSSVGGLLGSSQGGGAVSNSYNTGTVTGNEAVGGLVGQHGSTIDHSYSVGVVTGQTDVGGLVGLNFGNVNDSYSTGNVGGSSNVGGLVGLNNGTVSNSHYDADTVTINGGKTLTVGALYGNQYQDWLTHGLALNIADYAASLPYDTSGYYLVSNSQSLKDLLGFSDNPGYRFRLANDIDLAGLPGFYVPYFTAAEFDGAGRQVTGFSINASFTDNVGLFGFIGRGSSIGNIVVTNVNVAGANHVGGLVGENFGSIHDSHVTGVVSGASGVGGLVGYGDSSSVDGSSAAVTVSGADLVAGLVGFNAYSAISNSHATGNVSGQNNVGGLAGSSTGPISNSYATGNVSGVNAVGGLVGVNSFRITNSYASGNVSGNDQVGGLLGANVYDGGNVSSSYSTGDVTGHEQVGGLVGSNNDIISDSYATGQVSGSNYVGGLVGLVNSPFSSTSNSYATGRVNGNGADVGGLIGADIDNAAVNNSYWDMQASGQAASARGTGLTTAQMMQLASFSNWSIANTGASGATWRVYEGHTAPLLTSFLTPLTLTDAPDVSVNYNGAVQTGPSTAIAGVLGAAATGTNAGFYNGYYSTQQGYDITGGNLTINPAVLNAISLSGTRAYDGTVYVDHSIFTLSGLVGSETLTLSGVGTVADKNVGTNKPVTLGTLALGDGTNGGLASNYTFTGGTQVATITPAPLTISTSNVVKTYDGTTSALGSAIATAGTRLFDSDSLSGGIYAFTNKNAGTNKTVTVGSVTVNDGNGGGNYLVSYANNTTSTINPKPLTASIVGDPTKVYDGTTTAKLQSSNVSLTGVVSGESVTLAGTTTGGYNSKNVDEAISVAASLNASNFTAGTGTLLANYVLPTSASGAGHITPATLTYVADKFSVVQNSTFPTFTGSVTGFVNKETLASATTGTAKWSPLSGVTSSSAPGTYEIDGSGLAANHGNYVFVQSSGNLKALTITACKPSKNKPCP